MTRTQCLAALLFAAGTFLTGCHRTADERDSKAGSSPQLPPDSVLLPAGSPQRQSIRLATVEIRNVCTEEVTAPGKVEVNPARVLRVIMPVVGRITRVMVGLGDAVKPGQPLVSILSPEVSSTISAYRQAEARVRQAKSDLMKAESDLARNRDLYEHRALAQKEIVNSEAALAQARSGLEQAEAARSEGLRRLQIFSLSPDDFNQEIVVRSSLSGKVLELNVAPGEYRNDTSTPLMTIADLSSVYVAADVPEDRVRLVNVGEPVEVSLTAWPAEIFRGRVARIADTVDPQTRTVKVRAELPNQGERLRPEMFAQVLHKEAYAELPTVPAEAVIRGEDRATVWVQKGPDLFQHVDVRTGPRDDGRIAILSGVTAGDKVVVDGVMLLRSGS